MLFFLEMNPVEVTSLQDSAKVKFLSYLKDLKTDALEIRGFVNPAAAHAIVQKSSLP